MSIESSCSSCKFFRGRENDQWGECRRYPRRINPDSLSTLDFPGTLDSDWCGEWMLKRVTPVIVQEQKRPIAITSAEHEGVSQAIDRWVAKAGGKITVRQLRKNIRTKDKNMIDAVLSQKKMDGDLIIGMDGKALCAFSHEYKKG